MQINISRKEFSVKFGEKRDTVSSIKNPTSEFMEALRGAFGGGSFVDGVNVNEKTAMGVTAYWRCVSLLSQGVAGLPVKIYRPTENGREIVSNHRIADLFNRRINESMTPFTAREFIMSQTLTHGNGIGLIERDMNFSPVSILPIHWSTVGKVDLVEGRLRYTIRMTNNRTQTFDQDDIFHVKGPSIDGLIGMSVIRTHRETVGLAISGKTFGKKQFDRNFTATGSIETDNTLKPGTRKTLKEEFDGFRGPDGDDGFVVLDNGMKVNLFKTIPNADAQYIESRKFDVLEFATLFGVPPFMLGAMDKATFNNVEQMNIQFVQYSLMSWLKKMEQEIQYKLLKIREQEAGYYVRHNVDALMRGDSVSRTSTLVEQVNNGLMTLNEARQLEDRNPVDGGDIPRAPLNHAPINQQPDNSNTEND